MPFKNNLPFTSLTKPIKKKSKVLCKLILNLFSDSADVTSITHIALSGF